MVRSSRRAAPRPYHHGNLAPALVEAALKLIDETQDWDFSLREVARRAADVEHARADIDGDAVQAQRSLRRVPGGDRAVQFEGRVGEVLVAEEESEAVDAEGVAVTEAEAELVEPPEEEGAGTEGEAGPEEAADAGGEEAEANHEPEPEATADAAPEKAED